MDNFPEGISFADLEALLKDAQPEEDNSDCGHKTDDMDFNELVDTCAELKCELFRKTKSPLAMKMIILIIFHDMENWHERMGWETYSETKNEKALQEWLKDAGKIQAMARTLADIEITQDDPTPSWKQED